MLGHKHGRRRHAGPLPGETHVHTSREIPLGSAAGPHRPRESARARGSGERLPYAEDDSRSLGSAYRHPAHSSPGAGGNGTVTYESDSSTTYATPEMNSSKQDSIAGSAISDIHDRRRQHAHKVVHPLLVTWFPAIGFTMGIAMWLLDAAVDVIFIHPGESFIESVFSAEPTEMWMRTLVVLVMTISSVFVQYFMREQRTYQKLLLKYQTHLESMVHERTLELEQLATLDSLTQIYNRRKFNELLEHEVAVARRYDQPLSLVMFDIDHFKKINDQLGHAEGDRVLKTIGNILSTYLRKSDIYARWGGEEFILLTPHTDAQTAAAVAEKLRKLLNMITYGKNGRALSASFGVSQLTREDDEQSFIKRADGAMYKAKEQGRNSVHLAPEGRPR